MSDTSPPLPPTSSPTPTKSPKNEDLVIGGTYATDAFKQSKIPYCAECGESYHSDIYGNAVCAEPHRKKCPRMK